MSQRTFAREMEGRFGLSLAQLPGGLQQQLSESIPDWDVLSEECRQVRVAALDSLQTPYIGIVSTPGESDYYSDMLMKRADIEYEINGIEVLPAQIPSERESKERLLKPLKQKLQENSCELARLYSVQLDGKTSPKDQNVRQAQEITGDGDANFSGIRKHKLPTRRNVLSAVIELAKSRAINPDCSLSIWNELVKLANGNDCPAPLAGYSSDGIQYIGNKYELSQVHDILTKKAFIARMGRAR